ncbi:hypothetical protein OBBRIDRAFT_794626 [Obba rivulosa]|uniref:Uncharacterized protein n=1 Tax=Obba rivulosa TaxID=1052685 RepID=A0A8E2ATL9_9APHY|nr:hypothetical protein OBBRIDRAFT_794626 [Obba rivulosa]
MLRASLGCSKASHTLASKEDRYTQSSACPAIALGDPVAVWPHTHPQQLRCQIWLQTSNMGGTCLFSRLLVALIPLSSLDASASGIILNTRCAQYAEFSRHTGPPMSAMCLAVLRLLRHSAVNALLKLSVLSALLMPLTVLTRKHESFSHPPPVPHELFMPLALTTERFPGDKVSLLEEIMHRSIIYSTGFSF